MKFEKWQACGNDFIIIKEELFDKFLHQEIEEQKKKDCQLIRNLCETHYGIGADGILEVLPSEKGDGRMVIWNKDGTEAEMCGNGIRCAAKILARELNKGELFIETLAGVKKATIEGDYVSVEMGIPKIIWKGEVDLTNGKTFSATYLTIGNPHCIIFIDEITDEEVELYGSKLSCLPRFPAGANVEFVSLCLDNKYRIRARVWERGVGRTLACGTGACASAYAFYERGLVKKNVTIILDGGEVLVNVLEKDNILMSGDAKLVYTGEFDPNHLL